MNTKKILRNRILIYFCRIVFVFIHKMLQKQVRMIQALEWLIIIFAVAYILVYK